MINFLTLMKSKKLRYNKVGRLDWGDGMREGCLFLDVGGIYGFRFKVLAIIRGIFLFKK